MPWPPAGLWVWAASPTRKTFDADQPIRDALLHPIRGGRDHPCHPKGGKGTAPPLGDELFEVVGAQLRRVARHRGDDADLSLGKRRHQEQPARGEEERGVAVVGRPLVEFDVGDRNHLLRCITGESDTRSLTNHAVYAVAPDHVARVDRSKASVGIGDGDSGAGVVVNHPDHSHRPVHRTPEGSQPLFQSVLGLLLTDEQQIWVRAIEGVKGRPQQDTVPVPRGESAALDAVVDQGCGHAQPV
jgi:hypothetical protein